METTRCFQSMGRFTLPWSASIPAVPSRYIYKPLWHFPEKPYERTILPSTAAGLASSPFLLFEAFFNFTMKLIAAYLLAVLGGNTSPSADDIKNILESVGVEANDERLEFLLSELEGKDITEVIAAGREKFASVPSGGGGGIAVAAPTAAGGGAAPAEEAKKEEKVEEKEESDDDMGFSLFD
uniref:60S acidic ribosomal protein P2B n=1 Tax=Oryza meridionalis TaxID=40149 RepID=A0A0E0DS56_9ORYZ